MKSIQCRVMHFDLKAAVPNTEFTLKLMDDLQSFGYNYVLVEFEDKFPFEVTPEIVHQGAYTKAGLAQFQRPGLSVIPLMQCAGHLDYLLSHSKYAFLRDNGSTYQWDLRNEKAFELWTEMVEEILKVYPDAEYFHIGADEVKLDGEEGFEIYIKHVERCVDYLRAKGLKVLIWDDVFRRHKHPALERLLQKTVVCVWQYRGIDETLVTDMLKLGATVWGASRIASNTRYRGLGKLNLKFKNLNEWLEISHKYDLNGHIGTLWGRAQCHSPLNASLPECMYMAAYLAEGLLNGRPDRQEFDRKFAAGYFGNPEFDLTAFANYIGSDPDMAAQLAMPAAKHSEVMEIWTLFNELDCFLKYCDRCFAANKGMYAGYRKGAIPPKLTRNYLDGVRITRERAAELQEKIRRCFEKYYMPGSVEEYLSSRFDYLLEENERWGEIISAAAEKFQPQLPGKVF